MPQEKSCGVVVFREAASREYLLLHYEEGHWDFPKGHVEEGESELETAKRETAEETGIKDLSFLKGFHERIEYFYKREGQTMHKEVYFFLAKTKRKNVKLSFEHIGYVWLPYKTAYAKLTFKNAKEVLKKAEDFLNSSLVNYI